MKIWNNIYFNCGSNGSPRCIAEEIACVQRNDEYIFAVKAMFKMAPGWPSDDVFSVFEDGILCSAILEDGSIVLKNAKLFWDSYHFLNFIWRKQSGGAWNNELSSGASELPHSER